MFYLVKLKFFAEISLTTLRISYLQLWKPTEAIVHVNFTPMITVTCFFFQINLEVFSEIELRFQNYND